MCSRSEKKNGAAFLENNLFKEIVRSFGTMSTSGIRFSVYSGSEIEEDHF